MVSETGPFPGVAYLSPSRPRAPTWVIRCNNGWCAHVYDYYFEKDAAVQHAIDAGGHRHDWEHIIAFTQGDEAKIVAASKHGDYDTKDADQVRWDGSHPKVVYHKDGGSTHCFLFGSEGDDKIENHKVSSTSWSFHPYTLESESNQV